MSEKSESETNSGAESGSSSIGLLGDREIVGTPETWEIRVGRLIHVGGEVAKSVNSAGWIAYGHHPDFTVEEETQVEAIALHLKLRFSIA